VWVSAISNHIIGYIDSSPTNESLRGALRKSKDGTNVARLSSICGLGARQQLFCPVHTFSFSITLSLPFDDRSKRAAIFHSTSAAGDRPLPVAQFGGRGRGGHPSIEPPQSLSQMEPPKKRNVVTLRDLAADAPEGGGNGGQARENGRALPQDRRGKTNGQSFPPPGPPDDTGYCQPAKAGEGRSSNGIPLHAVPGLPKADVCGGTLKRIHDEFLPIIQRRGYVVTSISELCCCGDGLDHRPGRRGRGGRRMGDNVLGYNQTTSFGRRGGAGRSSHAIHLRLRDPRDHTRLFPWEDVAGTMAHELSHCVHQNHDEAFFKLMEEILEEHFNLQLYGPGGPGFLRPVNAHAVQRGGPGNSTAAAPAAAAVAEIPSTGGQRLGGRAGGRSRLLDPTGSLPNGAGSGAHRLGGGGDGTASRPPLTARELRERVAAAAEERQRQVRDLRRTIAERPKQRQPCVIEIFDDDDGDVDDDDAIVVSGGPPNVGPAATPLAPYHDNDDDDDDVVVVVGPPFQGATAPSSSNADTSVDDAKPAGKRKVPQQDGAPVVKDESAPTKQRRRNNAKAGAVIDLTTSTTQDVKNEATAHKKVPLGGFRPWPCHLCTYLNPPKVVECEMCLTRK
jgi:hypothetical protein